MRPALDQLRLIEHHLLGCPTPAEAAQWQVRLLTDPELATDAMAQRQLYQTLHEAGRRQLRQELELIHSRFERQTRRRGWLHSATENLRRLLGKPRR
ncbi:hypothetical protein [Hymenobacter chitinivorans]|uniref:Uncharacterized protein n=1 Tax=Hymenobacter chitinivorans DSM 11115 TaxID=1121954 RepID=A0A2M9B4X6_9BACT|nr:hypothetical protein [Hymenobacter chitinivorans]PJJ52993.1 hypothetical protein CLV45_3651 [Hymenobacter chitinivorans DSM 11115]